VQDALVASRREPSDRHSDRSDARILAGAKFPDHRVRRSDPHVSPRVEQPRCRVVTIGDPHADSFGSTTGGERFVARGGPRSEPETAAVGMHGDDGLERTSLLGVPEALGEARQTCGTPDHSRVPIEIGRRHVPDPLQEVADRIRLHAEDAIGLIDQIDHGVEVRVGRRARKVAIGQTLDADLAAHACWITALRIAPL
jgi:hypothetical protein